MASKKEKQSSRSARKCAEVGRIFLREELRAQYRRVNQIMKKPESERSEEEKEVLTQSQDMVKDIEKRTKLRELSKQRKLEIEDPADVLKTKCTKLAKVIQEAKNLVVYTGAGISTAASIPDYRGPNGVWTLLQQGIQPKAQDLTDSVPTYTHQCLTVLHQNGLVKYVVSQNCDGLHVRSGLDRMALSELHGNMFIEMCMACSPPVEYIRLFDVTEKTGLRKHKTGRFCSFCGSELRDTIVHFGEKGSIGPPHNWNDAAKFVDSADVLLCLGSSLKVLKNYPCLWHSHKPSSRRAKLYIVNLQWTPKDDSAEMKINGRCDDVMRLVMEQLGLDILQYSMMNDPLFYLATPLLKSELDTVHKKLLVEPPGYSRKQMEQRYGPRCYTFPSYIHPNSLHQQGKQWKARKTKPSVPIKKPTVTRKRDVKELRKKAMKEQPKRSAIVRRAKPDVVTSPKVKNGKSKLAMSAIMKTNGIKKSRRIKKDNTQILMEDESIKTDEDAGSVKHSPKSSDTSQKDDPELDSSDTMAGVSSRGSEGDVHDEELKQEAEESAVKNEDSKNETWLKEECKAEEDAVGISAYDEKLKDVENMDSLLDDVIEDGHVIEDYARSLETATDGTIALSRESEDSRTEGAGKASNSPTHTGSLLKDCSTTAMSGSSVDNAQGQTAASAPVSKDVGEATLESGSGTNVPAGCPLSLLSIDVSSLPARTEISNSLQDHDDSEVSLRQLYSDVNLGQDQIGHQLKENNPEELQSYLKPNDSSTTVSSSSTNLHLSSPASVQAHTQPTYQGGGMSASCVPGGGYVLAQPNSSRPATTNVGSVHAINTQSQTGLSCTSVMNSQTVTDLNECTTMEVRHLRLPHIPVIQNLQMAAGQHSSASNNLVTTSQNSSARTVTTSTPVPMVTMTVSEYLSSISLKRAAAATTTTTNSHHVSPSAYVQGSSTDHSSQLHVSVKPPVTQNQPNQTMAPNPVYATQSVPKVSALQIRPAVLLSPGNLIASAPSGYVHHALFTTAQASGTQTTVSTAATTGANLMTYNRAQHMQLPVQLPTQPSAAAPAVPTVTAPVNTTIGAIEQKRKSKGKVGKETVMPSGSTQTTLQQAAEEQRSPTKRKASVSPQLTSSKTSRVKSPTNVQALAASKAPLGSPDPAVYKYLSECLMRNIQLITGLHVMPLPQSGSLPQTEGQSLGNALSTTPSIVNSVTQIITSPMLQTTTVVKSKGARTKKQKSSKSASEATQPSGGGTMSMSSAAMTCASQSVIAEPAAQLQQSEAQTLVAQATTLPNAIVTSLVGAQPTQQQQAGPLPAHQAITETQQSVGNPSPAHQGASHYILNPAFQQMASADPGHVAAVQQMMALKGFSSQHPMTSMSQTTSGSKDLASITDTQQVLLASSSDYTALLQNIHQSQQQIVSTAPAMSQAMVSMPPKQSNQSTVSCPNIVAALGKPPSHSGWPVTPCPGINCGQQAMYAVQNATTNEGKTSDYLVNEQNSVNHVIADQQTDSASAAQNPEALKKSLHIKKILAHLQKATPGAPLPPYMYDNKIQPATSNQEVTGLPSGSQSLQGQQQVTEMAQHHKAMAGLQHGSAIQDPNAKNMVPATQMLHTAALADGQYSVNSGQLPWHQPAMTTGALSLGGSAPASLLSASLQGKALSDTSNQSGLQGVTPVSSLSHSTSFDSMHSQVTSSEDSNVLMSQFNNQLNQSPDPDICYETYLINDSVTGEEESSALQQAQAAVLQQLAYRNDTADDAQAVVVMDTQEVAFLDDIECEIEIQDGESLPEPSITEGIVDDVSVLTADSTAHTALADVQTTQNTGPPVYTEAVPEQTPDDGQIGQLGMRLSDDVDLAVTGTNMWDAQHPGTAQLVSANPGQVALDVNQVAASEPKQAQEQARSAPGWFGKGLHVKKPRRKRAK